jgi:hypothetical protein
MFNAAEKNFFSRMAFHMANGMDFDTAAKQVLADDQRLLKVTTGKSDEDRSTRRALARSAFVSIHAASI